MIVDRLIQTSFMENLDKYVLKYFPFEYQFCHFDMDKKTTMSARYLVLSNDKDKIKDNFADIIKLYDQQITNKRKFNIAFYIIKFNEERPLTTVYETILYCKNVMFLRTLFEKYERKLPDTIKFSSLSYLRQAYDFYTAEKDEKKQNEIANTIEDFINYVAYGEPENIPKKMKSLLLEKTSDKMKVKMGLSGKYTYKSSNSNFKDIETLCLSTFLVKKTVIPFYAFDKINEFLSRHSEIDYYIEPFEMGDRRLEDMEGPTDQTRYSSVLYYSSQYENEVETAIKRASVIYYDIYEKADVDKSEGFAVFAIPLNTFKYFGQKLTDVHIPFEIVPPFVIGPDPDTVHLLVSLKYSIPADKYLYLLFDDLAATPIIRERNALQSV